MVSLWAVGRGWQSHPDHPCSLAVGSLTFGGAMKTPIGIAAASMLAQKAGSSGGILTRGYHGRLKSGLLSPGMTTPQQAADFGDEACLYARAGFHVAKNADRRAGMLALGQSCQWVLLEDGLQTRSFVPKVRWVTLDPAWPMDRRRLWISGGVFRDTTRLLKFVDLCIWLAPPTELDLKWLARYSEAPHRVLPAPEYYLDPWISEAHVYANIARPERVLQVCHSLGVRVLSFKSDGDHHGLDVRKRPVIVTEKDATKLSSLDGVSVLRQAVRLPAEWEIFLP